MGVLKGFLYLCAGVFLLGGLGIASFAFPAHWLVGIVGLGVGGGLAYATFRAAQNFNVAQSDQQKLQLADTFKALAEKHGGSVPIEALMKSTGQAKEQVQANMKDLIGRGICELDFGPNGELLFKATPMDEARANLAAMSEKQKF